MIAPETIAKIRVIMIQAGVHEEDLEESFILGSGNGGQKVNKTSSTVRLYHGPSAMTVKCGATRSRETNRWVARRTLAERILEKSGAAESKKRQAAEKVRRQKRRRSRRQKARMLDDKHRHAEIKATRRPVSDSE